MSRLTYCDGEFFSGKKSYQVVPKINISVKDCIDKLGELENIEDELGCPLDVVFKALKDKEIVVKHTYGLNEPVEKLKTHKISGLSVYGRDFVFWLYENIVTDLEFDVNVEDYKKTWWLKEDLSE